MENKKSWIIFLIGIGFLFIMFSPKFDQPIVIIICGLLIVLIGVILLKKIKKSGKRD